MRIFLVRHGRSEANDKPALYAEEGDSPINLSDEGWGQAARVGAFIPDYIRRHPHKTSFRDLFNWLSPPPPIMMWVSAFMRGRQTASGMIAGSGGVLSIKNLRITDLPVEQCSGLFDLSRSNPEIERQLALFENFTKSRLASEAFYAEYLMGESAQTTGLRLRHLGAEIQSVQEETGMRDAVIVAHGYTIRAAAVVFGGLDPDRYSEFPTPQNGSVYVLEGDFKTGWTFKQIFNGKTATEVDIDWGRKLGMGIHTLPPVPEHIARKFTP